MGPDHPLQGFQVLNNVHCPVLYFQVLFREMYQLYIAPPGTPPLCPGHCRPPSLSPRPLQVLHTAHCTLHTEHTAHTAHCTLDHGRTHHL